MNILSIDFDIIMMDSIETYNHLANINWEERIKNNEILQFLKPNYKLYNYLTKYLTFLYKNLKKENFYFINRHELILNYLPKNTKFNLYHLDHHHDYSYNPKDLKNIKEINCGNWLKYLYDNNDYKINKVFWFNDYNSQNIKIPFDIPQNLIINDFKEFSNYDFIPDKVIISLSPQWIPPYILPLFYTWLDIGNILYNTHFQIDK